MEQTPVHRNVSTFYDNVNLDYLHWSPHLNIHFGYYKSGVNPFDLEAMLVQMNREVLERLALPNDRPSHVLDAGCGAGASCRFMANTHQGARFTGITLSAWQVEYGNRLNEQAGLSGRVNLDRMDFQATTFPDQYFDAAFAIESACYAEGTGKHRLIAELHRLIKPGGRLVIVDGFRKDSAPLPAWLDRVYKKYLSLWAVRELADIELFQEALQNTGFSILAVEDLRWRTAPTGLHIPFVWLKITLSRLYKRRQKVSREQKNYARALPLTLFLALFSRYFGYYMLEVRKKEVS